jgi:hypothetical protein
VVDVDAAGVGEHRAVVGAGPRARHGTTPGVGADVGPLAAQHHLAGVARAALADPVREVLTAVPGQRALRGDDQTSGRGGRPGVTGERGDQREQRDESTGAHEVAFPYEPGSRPGGE